MNVDINPVQVEQNIRQCAQRIADGVLVCDQRYRAWLAANREYDKAYAHAYMQYEGPAHERKYHAELATQRERENRDIADAAYRFADRQARALNEELRAWQSVGASVRMMWGTAGQD